MTIENFLINLIKPFVFFFYTLNMLDEFEKVTKGYKSYRAISKGPASTDAGPKLN